MFLSRAPHKGKVFLNGKSLGKKQIRIDKATNKTRYAPGAIKAVTSAGVTLAMDAVLQVVDGLRELINGLLEHWDHGPEKLGKLAQQGIERELAFHRVEM